MAALVMLSGLPAAGKTTFAGRLAARLGAEVLESDRVRRELFPRRRYTRGEHAQVFATVRARAEAALAAGRTVIVDATHLRERERGGVLAIAEARGARVVAVRLTAPEGVLRARLAGPRAGFSEATAAVYERMRGREECHRRPCVQVDSRYGTEASVALAAALAEDRVVKAGERVGGQA